MALRLTAARFAASSKNIVRAAPARALSAVPSDESYSDRMKKKYPGRPVSPHITVYAFPTVAISSVTVRITGCLLSIGLGGVAATALVGGVDAPAVLTGMIAASSMAPLAKFSVGFPLIYHTLGGVRHTVWDNYPEYLTNTSVEQSSWALFGSSGVLSLGASFLWI